jgi:hypothetical protein
MKQRKSRLDRRQPEALQDAWEDELFLRRCHRHGDELVMDRFLLGDQEECAEGQILLMPRDDLTYFGSVDFGAEKHTRVLRLPRPWPTSFDAAYDALCLMYVNFEKDRELWRQEYG